MIVDTRGLDYTESFRKVSSMVSSNDTPDRKVLVLVDSLEKSQMIKGFAEILLGCSTTLEKSSDSFIVRIKDGTEIPVS